MLSLDGLHRQCKVTSEDLLAAARDHIENHTDWEPTFDNCMRLAELSAYDFRTMAPGSIERSERLGWSAEDVELARCVFQKEQSDKEGI